MRDDEKPSTSSQRADDVCFDFVDAEARKLSCGNSESSGRHFLTESRVVDSQDPGQAGGKKGRRYVITTEIIEQNSITLQVCCALLVFICAGLVMFSVLYFGFDIGRHQHAGPSGTSNAGIGDATLRNLNCNQLLALLQSPAAPVQLSPLDSDFLATSRRRSRLLSQDAPTQAGTVNGGGDMRLGFDIWVDTQNTEQPVPNDRTYAVAGQELVIMRPFDASGGANASIISRMPLFTPDAVPTRSVLDLSFAGAGAPVAGRRNLSVEYGVPATFRAQQLLMSPDARTLLVIGTAISSAQVVRTHGNPSGQSPPTAYWSADATDNSTDSDYYVRADRRLFRSVAVLAFDVSSRDAPFALGMTEFEGRFVRVQAGGDGFAYLVLLQELHVPYTPTAVGQAWETEDVMPVYRHSAALVETGTAWAAVGQCEDVNTLHLSSGAMTYAPEGRLVTLVGLPMGPWGGPGTGAPADGSMTSMATAWDPEVPSLATTPGYAYIAQAVSPSPAAFGSASSSAPSAFGSSTAAVATAVTSFELLDGRATARRVVVQFGELIIPGCLAMDADNEMLLLVTTIKQDSATYDSSTVGLYAKNLTLVANVTEVMPDLRPSKVHFAMKDTADRSAVKHVFIAASGAASAQVFVMEIDKSLASSSMMRMAGRLYVNEQVDMLRTVFNNLGQEFLLVGGRPVQGSQVSAALSVAPNLSGVAQSTTLPAGFNLAIYNVSLPQVSQQAVLELPLVSEQAFVDSEAMHDLRALMVYSAGSSAIIALPVTATSTAAGAVCSRATLNNNTAVPSIAQGAYVWQLEWLPPNPANKTQPVVQLTAQGFITHTPEPLDGVDDVDFAGGCNHAEPCAASVIKRVKVVNLQQSGQTLVAISSSALSLTRVADLNTTLPQPSLAVVGPLHQETLLSLLGDGVLPPQTTAFEYNQCLQRGQCCIAI